MFGGIKRHRFFTPRAQASKSVILPGCSLRGRALMSQEVPMASADRSFQKFFAPIPGFFRPAAIRCEPTRRRWSSGRGSTTTAGPGRLPGSQGHEQFHRSPSLLAGPTLTTLGIRQGYRIRLGYPHCECKFRSQTRSRGVSAVLASASINSCGVSETPIASAAM